MGKSQQTAASAYESRLEAENEAGIENLTLRAGLNSTSGDIWLMINNTGGVSSTVESIYVSGLEGKALSNSSSTLGGTQFLTNASTGLNTTLPRTLDVGASTAEDGGNIQISEAAFDFLASGQPVFLNVLTDLGNVFSVAYPALNAATLRNVVINERVLDEYLSGTYYADSGTTDVISGCYDCVSSIYAGGNLLVLLLSASPSPVPNAGAINVTATVWDYSAYEATTADVVLNATYSGTASVTPSITNSNYECGSAQSIASGASAVFECSFTGNAGSAGGGAVTFSGEAKACVATGKTLSPCSSGSPADSSITGSNPVQIGTELQIGSWQPNYYYYGYTAKGLTGLGQLAVVSHTETYVAVYIQVTNEYSTPLVLLEGTFIQSVSSSIDFDFFMAEDGSAVYPTSGTPSFTPYQCTDSAPQAPTDAYTGQSCITVQPGQTVTIMFVAAASGGSTWEWGTTFPGGTSGYPGGDNMAILLDFASYNPTTGNYVVGSQDLPFEGLYVT